jgi:hypothetical protein
MNDSTIQKEVLVCGYDAAERVGSILLELGGGLVMCRVDTKDALLAALAKGRQPVCIIEHQVPVVDPVKQWTQVFKAGGAGSALASFLTGGLSSRQPLSLPPTPTAYALLPELLSRSPETKFVITSHTRGSGLSPEQRAQYKERPEVLKVMGFVNSTVNYHYLMKLFSRVYFDRAWKPRPPD